MMLYGLEFLIRQSLIWLAFLMFYQLFLNKNDNWPLKRSYLITTYLLGWMIPWLPNLASSPTAHQVFLTVPDLNWSSPLVDTKLELTGPVTSSGSIWSIWNVLIVVYLAGVLWQIGQLLRNYWRIIRWKRTGSQSRYQNYLVVKHPGIDVPFASLTTIFLPVSCSPREEDIICLHESIHLGLHHARERIPLLIGQALLWFHPLQWLFLHRLAELQEYEADHGVLKQYALREYGQLLIRASMLIGHHPGTGFFSSPLKKRIETMKRKKVNGHWRKGHTIVILFLTIGLIVSCSDLVRNSEVTDPIVLSAHQADRAPVLKENTPSEGDVDPWSRTLKMIYETIKYPKEARSAGAAGLFKASFIVDESGVMKSLEVGPAEEITDGEGAVKIVVVGYTDNSSQSSDSSPIIDLGEVSEIFEEEIKRTLRTLPEWEAAQHQGKAVSVRIHLYFKYLLEN